MGKEIKKSETAISAIVLESLKQLRKAEGFAHIDMKDMDHYNSLKGLVSEGYLEKNAKEFSITEKGLSILEDIENYISDEKMEVVESTVFELDKIRSIKEEKGSKDTYQVNYMRKHPTEDIIENHVAIFEKEEDGLPVIPVSEEAYHGLLRRNPGEHWRKYVSPAGAKLIREKKLDRVYIVNEDTGRKYMYCVPKK